jgi:hypothetical protein
MKIDKIIELRLSSRENGLQVEPKEEENGGTSIFVNLSDIKIIQNYVAKPVSGTGPGLVVAVMRSRILFRKGFPYKSLIVYYNPETLAQQINSQLKG